MNTVNTIIDTLEHTRTPSNTFGHTRTHSEHSIFLTEYFLARINQLVKSYHPGSSKQSPKSCPCAITGWPLGQDHADLAFALAPVIVRLSVPPRLAILPREMVPRAMLPREILPREIFPRAILPRVVCLANRPAILPRAILPRAILPLVCLAILPRAVLPRAVPLVCLAILPRAVLPRAVNHSIPSHLQIDPLAFLFVGLSIDFMSAFGDLYV